MATGFIIETELRPCMVGDKKALFHTWNHYSEIVPPSVMVGGHSGGVVSDTYAIVEYEDGSVSRCEVGEVRFLDCKIKEYCFAESEAAE